MNVLIAYDITDDRPRARVSAVLSAVGLRLQHSVFECVLSTDELKELMDRIRQLVDENKDVVQVFMQCSPCQDSRIDVGQVRLELDALCWVV